MLERAVTWIIILIVIVFDPLAVIMLLAAQMTFQWTKEQQEKNWIDDQADELTEAFNTPDPYVADVGEKPTAEELKETTTDFEGVRVPGEEWVQTGPEFEVPKKESEIDYQFIEEFHEEDHPPVTADSTQQLSTAEQDIPMPIEQWNKMIEEAEKAAEESAMADRLAKGETYIDGEGVETPLEPVYSEEDGSKKKTYMIKDPTGQLQTKTRE